MPKSVLVNCSFAQSLTKFRGELLAEMVRRGHRVHVTAPDFTDALRGELLSLGVTPVAITFRRTGQNPFGDLLYLLMLRRLIRVLQPDLVFNYTIKPNIWGSLAAASTGVPVASMITGVGYLLIEGTGAHRIAIQSIARALYGVALKRNFAVIFQNPDDVSDFLERDMVNAGQVRVVHGSGVNLEYFQPAPLPEEPSFLMIARLLKTKGVHEYVEAASQLKDRNPSARFRLVGMLDDGPDAADPDLIGRFEDSNVEYLGELKDVRPALAAASIYVLPSYREGTPRSVLEAMAMGRAVVTTDVPGCRETVVDGVNGVLVPARNAAILADAMEELANDPRRRASMGNASLRRARERFDVRAVNAHLLELLGL